MAMDDVSPERKTAMLKWHQAQHELQKGHEAKAMELARLALDDDPSFLEVRMWLAQYFSQIDEPRKASRELEEIILTDRQHADAWQLLEQVDPATAQRLKRLQSIAPDPFVVARTSPVTEDVADMGDFYDGDEYEGEQDTGEAGGDPFISSSHTDDILDDWEGEDVEEEVVEVGNNGGDGGPEPQTFPWMFEQDAEYLARWEAEPVVAEATAKIQELWGDLEAWEYVLNLCAHATPSLHEKVFEATKIAAARLGVEMPELFVFPERCMHPVLIKDAPPVLAAPSGVLRAMNTKEALFQIGREVGHLNTQYLAQMQVVKIVTDRKAQLAGDLASTLRDFLGDVIKVDQLGLSRDEVARLKKLGHAWQQRCELTADRAGVICCGDVDCACTAIAKTTASSIDEASIMTVDAFLKQFEGQDVGKLAAIPVEESPSRSPEYAAYRIHMLKWWAKTPEGMALLA